MDVRLLLEASNGLQTGLLESFRLRGECYLQSSSQLVASASISVCVNFSHSNAKCNTFTKRWLPCKLRCEIYHLCCSRITLGHVLTLYEIIHSTHFRRVPSERWSITSAQMKSFQNDICYHKQGSLCEVILSIW